MPELSPVTERSTADAFRAANLRQRVVTAVIIGVAFLALVLLSSPIWFAILSGAVFLIAAWEWSDLAGLTNRVAQMLYLVAFIAITSYVIALVPAALSIMLKKWLHLSVVFWLVALALVAAYPASTRFLSNPSANVLVGLILIFPTWLALFYLKQQQLRGGLILLVVAMIAIADMGAYFAGVRFGKHKLAPSVSPGKSWEGVAGGMLFNVLFVAGLSYYFAWTTAQGIKLALVAIAVTAASIVGDLFESMIKRQRGVKDSGTILPGHGGILDRIDGWMAAVPVFTLLYMFGCTGLP